MVNIIIISGILLISGLLFWLIGSVRRSSRETADTAIGLLQQQLESLRIAQDKVSETLGKSMQTGQENVNKSLRFNQETLGKLNLQIGELQGTNKQMLQMSSDIRRLQGILASPKLRGGFGEWSLESLLKNILPQDSFQLQYQFKDGRMVDALIRMPEYSVPVDAKFPLPNFEAMQKSEDENEKKRFRNEFLKDVRKHIDKIADSYIRPAEGTLDFALMYIPAENIYYETIVQTGGDAVSIQQYAMDKKVIAVSPNLLYAYLMTVVMGLHGLQIEKQAAEIRQNLKKLNASLGIFISNWDTLGSHLRNAQNKYDDGQKRLDKFITDIEQIQSEQV
ncbi:MAG: DNA recombination protein RmuC [Planctomycetes bacterium]|nr:DNA recombination protein RmuC [Planctomycetota bacterium]